MVSFSYHTHVPRGVHADESTCLLAALEHRGLLLVKPFLTGFRPRDRGRPVHFVPANLTVFMQSACAVRTSKGHFESAHSWFTPVPTGMRLLFAAFTSCIAIHHYFIDGAVWKLSNPQVRRELFSHLSERKA